ncbi:MAG: PIN domain-containing protein [Gammaproteobacteria bacterium]|nr:PIN domain-containing protein [Gammaproteobacteria bacterium]
MNADCFLDTNVLVYAVASDPEVADKRYRALALIESRDFALSAQVLQEFYVTVTRKLSVPLGPDEALAWIEQLETFPCVEIDAALVKIAAEVSERYRTSYWDGAILAAAAKCGVETVYSEDLNHGQRYGEVMVINPFAEPDAAPGLIQE